MIVCVFMCSVSDVFISPQRALWLIEWPFTLVEVYITGWCDSSLPAPITPLVFTKLFLKPYVEMIVWHTLAYLVIVIWYVKDHEDGCKNNVRKPVGQADYWLVDWWKRLGKQDMQHSLSMLLRSFFCIVFIPSSVQVCQACHVQ